ncbi:MAG TPA: 6-bladed beta-propeller [Gemmatimonadaceae bacterium]|nr:6-bladed beta-propeller [Gemmatimonadaceae bacterium]
MNAHRLFATATALIAASSALGAQPRWKLTETLRIGGADTGATSFSQINALDADTKGRILVFDRSTLDLRMFSADGKLVRVIGRSGSGPGEFRRVQGFLLAHDGRIWVRDQGNQRYSVFSSDGDLERTVLAQFCSYGWFWDGVVDRAGNIVDPTCVAVGGRGQGEWAIKYSTTSAKIDTVPIPRCGAEGAGAASVFEIKLTNGVRYVGVPFVSRPLNTLGLDNDRWCAPSSGKYEILRVRLGTGDTLAPAARAAPDVAPLPVSSVERDSAIREIEKGAVSGPLGLDYGRIPKTKPIIDAITVDDQSRLWVRRTTAKRTVEFDVFSTNGRLIAVAELTARTQPFSRVTIRGENLYAVVLDDDDVPYVARFRIAR